MKAISMDVPGGPEVLHLVDVPEPLPGPEEVTIEVSFAGVGLVDTFFRRGLFPHSLPLIPGIEVAGRVHALGSDVTHLKVRQPVAAFLNDFVHLPGCGGYAQVALARAALTVPLEENSDPAAVASVVMNGTTAMMAVRDVAMSRPGEKLMVLGATGGLGSMLGRIASIMGATRLIGVIGSESNRELAERIGYTETVTADELKASVFRKANGGLDVVFDTTGGDLRGIAFSQLAPLGRMVILGNASGVDHAFSADQIWIGTKSVMGLNVGGLASLVPARITAAARDLLELLAQGKLDAPPVHIRSLAEASQVHQLLEGRKLAGKAVLRV
jgi:NADPH2:quinone reductase